MRRPSTKASSGGLTSSNLTPRSRRSTLISKDSKRDSSSLLLSVLAPELSTAREQLRNRRYRSLLAVRFSISTSICDSRSIDPNGLMCVIKVSPRHRNDAVTVPLDASQSSALDGVRPSVPPIFLPYRAFRRFTNASGKKDTQNQRLSAIIYCRAKRPRGGWKGTLLRHGLISSPPRRV